MQYVAPKTLVAVSLETTGLTPLQDRITELGAVRFDYEGNLFDTFWEQVNPGVPIPEHIAKLTGITNEQVAGARPPAEVVEAFFAWAGRDAWLVAHSGGFEAAFLFGALVQRNAEMEDCPIISTLHWARDIKLPVPNYRLATLLDYIEFGIRIQPLRNTLIGAQAVADLMLFLLRQSYPEPTHAAVKDTLVFRAESIQSLVSQ